MVRKFLTVAVRDLLILALILGCGEISVRLFYPQASRYIFSPTVTGGHPIVYNSHGLRDEEFPGAPPEGELRVLCLGDSTTFGAGIPAGETYPKQMERILNGEGERWRVVNAGGQGASVSELTRFLIGKRLSFRPRVVTLGFSPTMVGLSGRSGAEGVPPPPAAQRTAGQTFRRALLNLHLRLHGSYLYVLVDANLRRRLYRWGVIRDRMDAREGALFAYAFDVPGVRKEEVEASYRVLEQELTRCRDLLRLQEIPVVVIGLPSRFSISGRRQDNERGYDLSKARIDPMDRMAGICSRLDLPFVDPSRRLAEAAGEVYIPSDYAHLNARGMRIAAEDLAQAVRELDPILGK